VCAVIISAEPNERQHFVCQPGRQSPAKQQTIS
jgi:hypothetical protein